jgi:hypothetical protein
MQTQSEPKTSLAQFLLDHQAQNEYLRDALFERPNKICWLLQPKQKKEKQNENSQKRT